jgi:two-component system, LytTR family, response regulator
MNKTQQIKALIIDDEPPARKVIREFVSGFPEIEVLAEFADGFSGLKGIQELNPDLVFLDIQMPKLTGFEMLELLDEPPLIIFSTAYDQYALKAFEQNAVDYLLKPYARERFEKAVAKAIETLNKEEPEKQPVKKVLDTVEEQPGYLNRIAVKIRRKVHVIPIRDITYIEADGDYVTLHAKGEKYLKEKTMKYFESHLDPAQFVRIHRSSIINVDFMDKIEYYDKESHMVLLKDGTRLKASTSGYRSLKKVLNL